VRTMTNANWYKELLEIDKEDHIVAIAVKENNWRKENLQSKLFASVEEAKHLLVYNFDRGYGGSEGPHFTAWSEKRVYFPGVYDGAEWIDSVPRHPCDEATKHIGGE